MVKNLIKKIFRFKVILPSLYSLYTIFIFTWCYLASKGIAPDGYSSPQTGFFSGIPLPCWLTMYSFIPGGLILKVIGIDVFKGGNILGLFTLLLSLFLIFILGVLIDRTISAIKIDFLDMKKIAEKFKKKR